MTVRPATATASWLVSYGDMMSLLLVLFAYLFSLNTLRPARHVSMHSGPNRFGLPVILEVYFEPGRAVLSVEAKQDLRDLARKVAWEDSPIVLVGYTSPYPVEAPTKSGVPRAAQLLDDLSTRRLLAVESELRSDEACIVYGAIGANYLSLPLLREPPYDRNVADKVEVCYLTTKLGREN